MAAMTASKIILDHIASSHHMKAVVYTKSQSVKVLEIKDDELLAVQSFSEPFAATG